MRWNRLMVITGATALILSGCAKTSATPAPAAGKSGTTQPAQSQSSALNQSTTSARADARNISAKAWEYLKANYNKGGDTPSPMDDTWGPDCNPGFSGFIVLGALRAGLVKPDDKMIRDTVHGMSAQQRPTGAFDFGKGNRAVYVTSIVLETFSWLRDHGGPEYKSKLGDACTRAMEYLKHAQVGAPQSPMHDATKERDPNYGGWAYSVEELADQKNAGKPRANLSTSIFALDAAKTFGLDPKDPLWNRAVTFLERNHNASEVSKGVPILSLEGNKPVKDPEPGSPDYGGARYAPNESKAAHASEGADFVVLRSYGSMTYALLRGYLMTGLDKNDVRVQLAATWIKKNFAVDHVPGFVNTEKLPDADQQGLYYQAMQMARTLRLFGEDEFEKGERGIRVNWRKELVAQLSKSQHPDGRWQSAQPRWEEGHPTLATGYVLNALADVLAE